MDTCVRIAALRLLSLVTNMASAEEEEEEKPLDGPYLGFVFGW